MLVDSHCHLDFPDFADDLDGVIARAQAAGVAYMLTICTRLHRLERTLELIERYDGVYGAAGVHPHEAEKEGDVALDRLVEIARHPKIVGIGETGLDFYYDHSPRAAQEASFRTHIRAARETGLPLIVHTRDADADTARVLAEEGAGQGGDKPLRGLIHCFSSGRELAEAAIGFGFLISLSGIFTFKRSQAIRDIVADLPIDRLLVETDAPYLTPDPMRKVRRNEPAMVVHTAARLGEVKGLTPAETARRTTANFFALFDKVPAPAVLGAEARAAS
ncbi:MAG: YchF/TatD family DNA exonuclease [Alphaproteobacteria bacterium]|jgi:TatD DNase family protein|nr:YchF/TatD family DNA exonuclease [Alphaproteobacteria bacterium]